MNKKTYQKPAMDVKELAMKTAILAGSNPQAVFSDDDNDIIETGNVDARQNYGVWND